MKIEMEFANRNFSLSDSDKLELGTLVLGDFIDKDVLLLTISSLSISSKCLQNRHSLFQNSVGMVSRQRHG